MFFFRCRLLKRFELRENSKTSASEVIRLYEKEKGHQDSYIPLQSYQVSYIFFKFSRKNVG